MTRCPLFLNVQHFYILKLQIQHCRALRAYLYPLEQFSISGALCSPLLSLIVIHTRLSYRIESATGAKIPQVPWSFAFSALGHHENQPCSMTTCVNTRTHD